MDRSFLSTPLTFMDIKTAYQQIQQPIHTFQNMLPLYRHALAPTSAERKCRLCTDTERYGEIFDEIYRQGKVASQIYALAGVQVNIPALICARCLSRLNNFDSFRDMIRNSDRYFNSTTGRSELGNYQYNQNETQNYSRMYDENATVFKTEPELQCKDLYTQHEEPQPVKEVNLRPENQSVPVLIEDDDDENIPPIEIRIERVERPASTQPEMLTCKHCDKLFTKQCYLTQHTQIQHSGEKPFKCEACGKRFARFEMLKNHRPKHDLSLKAFKCESCPKTFSYKIDLKRHALNHEKFKPFYCEDCKKGFVRFDQMVKHNETMMHKKMAKEKTKNN